MRPNSFNTNSLLSFSTASAEPATDSAALDFKETEVQYSKIPYSERIIRVRTRSKEEEGKYAARALRERGEVPGTLYGGPRLQRTGTGGERQVNDCHNICVVDIIDLAKQLRTHQRSFFCLPFQLQFEDGETEELVPAVATGMQTHPTTRELLSLNFLRVEPEGFKHKPKVEVPITYIDKDRCPGLKLGGI